MKPAKKDSKPSRSSRNYKKQDGFTEEERAAMRDRVQEMRSGKGEGEEVVRAKIAGMSEPDRSMGKRLHAIVKANAPMLSPRLWYGMPAYAKEGKVICFFQPAAKFKTRYATLGFSDKANLDEGPMWPTTFALKAMTAAEEERVGELVKKATSE